MPSSIFNFPYYPDIKECVKFVGKFQYPRANAPEGKAVDAIPCIATVERMFRVARSKHPYKLKGVGVNGWVNEEDITPL